MFSKLSLSKPTFFYKFLRYQIEAAIYNAGILATYVADGILGQDFENYIVPEEISFALTIMNDRDFDEDFQEMVDGDNGNDGFDDDDDEGDDEDEGVGEE